MQKVDKAIVKSAISKATAEITEQIQTNGFERTKKWFWVRPYKSTADFIHIHVNGSSYGVPINYSVSFRVHLGTREYKDSFETLALNGPHSDAQEYREKRYHMRFNAKSGSTYDRCIEDIVRFISQEGEAWFKSQSSRAESDEVLLDSSVGLSRKLLGLK